ncbi:hypothetical protein ACJIZ3_018032 [Penstemon smallii]|uniref:Gem-associated protein 2 n=1 Tax=Penstemon smallii TaxID=265156 RepID=A0ABD3SXP4_9LAMI
MADALHSANGTAAEFKLTQTTNESPPYLEKHRISKGTDNVVSGDAIDYSETRNEQAFVSHRQENTLYGVVQEEYANEMSQVNKQEGELQVNCSEKFPHKILQAIDEIPVIGNEKLDCDILKGKKEKRSKRRSGKGRKNKDSLLNCFNTVERKDKKGFVYSREELEAMRFVEFEEQKKKWIEVYCGLGTLVAQEYDRLVDFREIKYQQEHVVDFDPRPKFQKFYNLGEDCSQFVDSHFLDTSDPASCLPVSDEIGCSVLEGECSQDDDSDEDYSGIQKPAFVVKGEPDFDSGPPQDGLEFLRRVSGWENGPFGVWVGDETQLNPDWWEAAQIPKVKVAKVGKTKEQSRSYMPQIPDIEKCPDNLLPLKEWENSFLADFSELRLRISQLEFQDSSSNNLQPVHKDNILAQMFESMTLETFDITASTQNSCPPEATENCSIISDYPTLSAILKMDPASRNSMLKKQISLAENINTMQRNDCLWLFALCAAVDCPLDADTCAALRSLLRKCASLLAAKIDLDDEAIMLNILVTISGRFFGQSEK